MRGRTFVAVIAALAAAAGALPPATDVQAQETAPPVCTERQQRLLFDVPPFVHPGARFEMFVADDAVDAGYVVADAVATVAGERTAVPVDRREVTGVRLRAPRQTGPATVTVAWLERPVRPQPGLGPCTRQATVQLTVLPAAQKIGDLWAPRIDGRYRSRLEPVGWPRGRSVQRSTLHFRAACAVGACALRESDSPVIPRRSDGSYESVLSRSFANCTGTDGVLVKRAWRARDVISFRPVRDRRDADGQLIATHWRGEFRRELESTGRGRTANCRGSFTVRWRFSGELL